LFCFKDTKFFHQLTKILNVTVVTISSYALQDSLF
jgi:hypothetical protein